MDKIGPLEGIVICIDSETTGVDPDAGDRIVEIAGIEINDGLPTGREFHAFVNPSRDIPVGATEIHGITTEFLNDKPLFEEIARDFLAFVEDHRIAAHNAEFDLKFINAELRRCKLAPSPGSA